MFFDDAEEKKKLGENEDVIYELDELDELDDWGRIDEKVPEDFDLFEGYEDFGKKEPTIENTEAEELPEEDFGD